MVSKEQIIKEFNRIKDLGYIKSRRNSSTGIGKTFEDYLGVTENNDKLPDFAGFEVKSQRTLTSSFLTLFTKSPTGPKGANTYLRDTYGEEYKEYVGLKKIHTSIFSDRFNTYRNQYAFKIKNESEKDRIILVIKSLSTQQVIDDKIYWSYEALEKALIQKLQALFYVTAKTRREKGIEYFHYNKAKIFLQPNFNNFLSLIDEGKLMIDIRIGSYKSGKKKGKTHDHGTGFRIKPADLNCLYTETFDIS